MSDVATKVKNACQNPGSVFVMSCPTTNTGQSKAANIEKPFPHSGDCQNTVDNGYLDNRFTSIDGA